MLSRFGCGGTVAALTPGEEEAQVLSRLALQLREIACEEPEIMLMGHELARRIEGYLAHPPHSTRRGNGVARLTVVGA